MKPQLHLRADWDAIDWAALANDRNGRRLPHPRTDAGRVALAAVLLATQALYEGEIAYVLRLRTGQSGAVCKSWITRARAVVFGKAAAERIAAIRAAQGAGAKEREAARRLPTGPGPA
jgi:hypothetical protein